MTLLLTPSLVFSLSLVGFNPKHKVKRKKVGSHYTVMHTQNDIHTVCFQIQLVCRICNEVKSKES